MSFENYILIFLYSALSGYGLIYFFKYKRVNPVFWFILFQWLMVVGSLYLADLDRASDQFYILLFFIAQIVYIVSAIFFWKQRCFNFSKYYKLFWSKGIEFDHSYSRYYLKFIVGLSIIITVLYYNAVGYNMFLDALLGKVLEDYSSLRLAMYSGENYYAAGYVNQFKNVLLPVGLSVLAGWAWLRNEKFKLYMIVMIGGSFAVIALLGTGQRAFLAYSFAALVFGLSAITKIKLRTLILPFLVIFILFSYMTSMYMAHTIDAADVYKQSVVKSLNRFFLTEQEGSLGAFRYLYTLDTVFFEEWKDQLVGIIPGHKGKGSTLQHDLYYLVHGTDRGTEGYATVAGCYYNGGLPTVIIFYALMAFFHCAAYYRFLKGRKTIFRVFVYAALFFYLSIFVSGGPETMINRGMITLMILLFIRKIRLEYFPKTGQRNPVDDNLPEIKGYKAG